jgi:hypothetical protein
MGLPILNRADGINTKKIDASKSNTKSWAPLAGHPSNPEIAWRICDI